jgi:hypothetical protein
MSLETLILHAALRGGSREGAKPQRKDAKGDRRQRYVHLFAPFFAPSREAVLYPSVQSDVGLGHFLTTL